MPSVNLAQPAQCWQWTVLPQGMKNSPVICQLYVAKAIAPLREGRSDHHVVHYMDDILLAAPTEQQVEHLFQRAKALLQQHNLSIAEAKIQRGTRLQYLGMTLTGNDISPQPIALAPDVAILHDVQKLVGALQWLRTFVCIPLGLMQPFYELLKGEHLWEPRTLMKECQDNLKLIQAILQQQRPLQ